MIPIDLTTNYQFELVEDHYHPGSGNYSVRIMLPGEIRENFPYLNTMLDDTKYGPQNYVLIGSRNKVRYAFRPHEIRVVVRADGSNVSNISKKAIDLVNQTSKERNYITPSLIKRRLPPMCDIFKSLPRTNCKKCGYPSCLAFASALRSGEARPEHGTLFFQPEYSSNRKNIIALLSTRFSNKLAFYLKVTGKRDY